MLNPHDLTQTNVIYGLHSGDGVIRYVGLTTGTAKKRFYEHCGHASGRWPTGSKTYVYNWMNKVGIDNVVCEVLQVCELDDIAIWEMIWIEHLRNLEYPLTNLTDGGDGRFGYKYTEEQKLAASIRQRGENGPRAVMSAKEVEQIWRELRAGIRPLEVSSVKNGQVNVKTVYKIMSGVSWVEKVPEDVESIRKMHKQIDLDDRRKAFLGSRNGQAKITENDVIKIRALLSEGNLTQTRIASMFQVSDGIVSQIKLNKIWRHV